ncbi:hypothetical protein D3C87_1460300 [compost metagenome]
MVGEGLQDQFSHRFGVGRERHRQLDLHQPQRVRVRHVAHGLCHEFRVRHDHGRAVAHLNFGGAHVDAQDVAFDAAQRHPIAHFHRPFGQQDQARHEVLHHGLQAETDTHR